MNVNNKLKETDKFIAYINLCISVLSQALFFFLYKKDAWIQSYKTGV